VYLRSLPFFNASDGEQFTFPFFVVFLGALQIHAFETQGPRVKA